MEIAAVVAFAQDSAVAPPPDAKAAAPERLFDLWRSTPEPRLPLVDLNRSAGAGDVEALLDRAGVPVAAAYMSPVIQYWEHSPLYRIDTKRRHLLVQLALTGDSKRMQVLVVEASSMAYEWKVTRSRIGYGSSQEFAAIVTPVIAAAAHFYGHDVGYIPVCSHNPLAGIAVHLPYDIQLARNPTCPGGAALIDSGNLVIAAAEKILGEKIERAAKFD